MVSLGLRHKWCVCGACALILVFIPIVKVVLISAVKLLIIAVVKVITGIKVIVCMIVQIVIAIIVVIIVVFIIIIRAAIDIAGRVRYWEGLLGMCWHMSFLQWVLGSKIIMMGILSVDRVGWQLTLARCNYQAG